MSSAGIGPFILSPIKRSDLRYQTGLSFSRLNTPSAAGVRPSPWADTPSPAPPCRPSPTPETVLLSCPAPVRLCSSMALSLASFAMPLTCCNSSSALAPCCFDTSEKYLSRKSTASSLSTPNRSGLPSISFAAASVTISGELYPLYPCSMR